MSKIEINSITVRRNEIEVALFKSIYYKHCEKWTEGNEIKRFSKKLSNIVVIGTMSMTKVENKRNKQKLSGNGRENVITEADVDEKFNYPKELMKRNINLITGTI